MEIARRVDFCMRFTSVTLILLGCASSQATTSIETPASEAHLSPIVTTIDGEPIPLSRVAQLADELGDAGHEQVYETLTAIHASAVREDSQHLGAFADAVIPELVALLDWNDETMERAIDAARLLSRMQVPERHVGRVVDGLMPAFRRIEENRGIDNRLRIETIRALGNTRSSRAVPPLLAIAAVRDPQQSFLINRLAIQAVTEIADPRAVGPLIGALFAFAPDRPTMRLNDVAAEALIYVGDAAHEPLVALVRGENAAAQALVDEYIEAVRQLSPEAADEMVRDDIIQSEAAFVLGMIGDPRAIDVLVELCETAAPSVRVSAALALTRLNASEGQRVRVRHGVRNTYDAVTDLAMRAQLAAAMRYLYDRALLPFLLVEAQHDREPLPLRLELARSYAMLANREDARALAAVIERVDEDEAYVYESFAGMIAAANECDEEVACWLGKLDDDESAEKAAAMLALLGRGNARVVDALIDQLDHVEVTVRNAAVMALDHVATAGSARAVRTIEELREHEEGRAIWNEFARIAMPVRARLSLRAPE